MDKVPLSPRPLPAAGGSSRTKTTTPPIVRNLRTSLLQQPASSGFEWRRFDVSGVAPVLPDSRLCCVSSNELLWGAHSKP